jgi:hypothetical protein
MKSLLITSYSNYIKSFRIFDNYLLGKFELAKSLPTKRTYTINLVFSFKKKISLQITGFCKFFTKNFSKGCSFHIIYTYGKSNILSIFPFYSPKFLSFFLNK